MTESAEPQDFSDQGEWSFMSAMTSETKLQEWDVHAHRRCDEEVKGAFGWPKFPR